MTKGNAVYGFAVFSCLAVAGCHLSGEAQTTELETMTDHESNQAKPDEVQTKVTPTQPSSTPETAVATFGAGCFWCVEAVFEQLEGVISVESGYSGGSVENPSYQLVCSGLTGHAEVCQIEYDPSEIRFQQLLEVFWKTHDPTTLNRQGADVGTQYRSAVFYHDDRQRELAEQYKKKLDESGAWDKPIVTEISPFTKFYKAEDDHQNYFRLNPNQGYCRAVIQPKLEKFREVFSDQLKEEASADP